MHPQGINSPTFSATPLDGSLTVPQILDLQLKQSPDHTAYIYDDAQGEIVHVKFSQYIGAVHAAATRILCDMAAYRGQGATVIGIFADTDTLSYCEVSLILCLSGVSDLRDHLGLVPFCISPRNAAPGLANLLEKTNPTVVYVSPHGTLKDVLSEALAIATKELPVFQALSFEQFRGETCEPLPPISTAPMDSTALILHSSGSTSVFSRPIYFPHKLLLQYASVPWSGAEDFCGMAHSEERAVRYFTCLKAIIATKPDFVMSTPASIEVWSEDPIGLKVMQSLKYLSYLGAQLNKRVGDALVAQGVVLCSSYGSMETGLVTPFLNCYGKDWDYFSVRQDFNPVRVPEDDGSKLYTHTYLVSPSYVTCYINSEIDGRPGCSVSDLLEQHPEKPELHRVYGRKDDIIIFSSGAKMNPVPTEAQINRNRFVDSALVFGRGRTHPGLIVQLKPEFQAENLSTEILDAIWYPLFGHYLEPWLKGNIGFPLRKETRNRLHTSKFRERLDPSFFCCTVTDTNQLDDLGC
ncbi:hypothetical protein C8R43DRAFT_954442 [Mycena crocata]|nr:hypothetical protein C8R43DRAFT_954442 [Mycena crocata]